MRKLFYFMVPVVAFLTYVFGTHFVGLVVDSPVRASMAVDLVFALSGFLWYVAVLYKYRLVHNDMQLDLASRSHDMVSHITVLHHGDSSWLSDESVTERFRPRAWAVFLWLVSVILVWFVTQCMSTCVSLHVFDTGIEGYNEAVTSDIGLWIILAVFIAPVAEEVIFRLMIYGLWQKVFGGVAAAVLSSVLFAAIHGTLAHLPVAFLMGMFNVVVWEVTGEFKYPVLSHMLYNFLSVGAVIPVRDAGGFLLSVWFNVLAGIAAFVLIVLLYLRRDAVRRFLVTANVIDYLNRRWDE